MALDNPVVKETYQGDGSNTTFAIPFDYFNEADVLVYLRDNTDPLNPVLTLLVQGEFQDYTLTGATPPTTPLPINVEMNDAPTATQQLVVMRRLDLEQIISYTGTNRFPAAAHELGLDRIVAMIQQIQEQVSRALVMRLDEELDEPFVIPLPQAETVLGWNEDGTEIKYYTMAELATLLAESGGGGLPPGGDQYALVEKLSSEEGEAGWTLPLIYQGFSERFSQLVNLSGIKAVLDYIMDMGYAPPTVSLGTSPSYSVIRERGDTISAVDLTANIVKTLENIGEVRFYRGATLIDTQTSGGGIPNGGNSTYTDSNAFSDNRSYSVQVDDVSSESKPSATSTRNFVFVYPYYYGVGAAGLGASVAGLTKQIIQEATSAVRSFSPNGSQKMYFAYPASYGNLTSILDINSFNTIADWTKTTTNITGLDGNPVSYNIYEFNNFAVAGTYQYTFIQ